MTVCKSTAKMNTEPDPDQSQNFGSLPVSESDPD